MQPLHVDAFEVDSPNVKYRCRRRTGPTLTPVRAVCAMQLTHLRRFVRSAEYIESTYNYETTDVQMRSGKAVRARHRQLSPRTLPPSPPPRSPAATSAPPRSPPPPAPPARSPPRTSYLQPPHATDASATTRHGACHRPRCCRPRRHLPRRRRRRLSLTLTLTQVAVPKKIEYQFRTQVIR